MSRRNKNRKQFNKANQDKQPTYITFDFEPEEIAVMYAALLEAPMNKLLLYGFSRHDIEAVLERMEFVNDEAETSVKVSLYD